MSTTPQELLQHIFTKRSAWAQKGDAGKVLVISGSAEYSGSPIFNAMAALRSGADLVTVVGHPRAMQITATYAPDIITFPLSGELTLDDVPFIVDRTLRATGVVIGSGLPRTPDAHKAIAAIVEDCTTPLVLDAEAIRAIVTQPSIIAGKRILLTPNAREFATLVGDDVEDNVDARKAQVRMCAEKLQTTILLKGHVDVISDGIEVAENHSGTPLMSKGGFGDTLAGIAGALLARGATPFEAGCLAAYINGQAGSHAGKQFGESLLASDMLDFIPHVLHEESTDTN